jgi:hypothetical protein
LRILPIKKIKSSRNDLRGREASWLYRQDAFTLLQHAPSEQAFILALDFLIETRSGCHYLHVALVAGEPPGVYLSDAHSPSATVTQTAPSLTNDLAQHRGRGL